MKNLQNLLSLVCLLFFACTPSETVKETSFPKLPQFSQISASERGINFINALPEDKFRNILRYQYYYNGGGVAVGDVNGDGLPDICFSGNVVPPKLFLNKGNFQFEDATASAGLSIPGQVSWNTGISMIDINADGRLDIYLCRSGNLQPDNRRNLLYINQGNGNFAEQGKAYGLDDPGYSIHAAFLDYDKDGDLDMYLTNHGINFYGRDQQNAEQSRNQFSGDKLFRNDNGTFKEVTAESGIYERGYSYGLGLGIGDLNGDGFDDIYVSNDFYEHDYLYWNKGDGTFKEAVKEATQQTSYFGMGNDLVDINNDGLLDIMVVDMMAKDHVRRLTNLAGLSYEKFWDFVDKGYHFQYMYNSLNINNGNQTFSNWAQLANIAQTDWSWAPLVADFDNDGYKDVYITNGLRKDVLNLDFINNIDARFSKFVGSDGQLSDDHFRELLQSMPTEKVQNVAYRNTGGLPFKEVTQQWGFHQASFSNGAAFADFDQDGDLDLIVNNIDEPPFLFRNNQEQFKNNHYLNIYLKGPKGNPFALGTKIYLRTAEGKQFQQLFLSRGYQSSIEPLIHFGLGESQNADLEIIWPDGLITVMENVSANQKLNIDYGSVEKQEKSSPSTTINTLFKSTSNNLGLSYIHRENDFEDFKREFLLPHKMSTLGPVIAVADINGDDLVDCFIGGAAGSMGTLFIQTPEGAFTQAQGPWQQDSAAEDLGSCFFDIDQDGDQDLYVSSGGNEFEIGDKRLQDRFYINDGTGKFSKAAGILPELRESSSCVKVADYDSDGDMDVFVGGRQIPGQYPLPANSYFLNNENGKLLDITSTVLPDLKEIGMVTDALWTDFNTDGQVDLIVVGEWMQPLFFKNENGKFSNVTAQTGLPDLTGWYFSIAEGDFDQDGDSDYIIGNLGLNHRFKADAKQPFEIIADDWDANGSIDPILVYTYNGNRYPLYGRQVLQEQWTDIKKRYPDFTSYANASIDKVLDPEKVKKAVHYQATNFASLYIENKGDAKFEAHPLPDLTQTSSGQAILIDDYNKDGHLDALLAGNLYGVEYRTARLDAGTGTYLQGDGKGGFKAVPSKESGFFAAGNVKSMATIKVDGNPFILIGNNDDALQIIRLTKD